MKIFLGKWIGWLNLFFQFKKMHAIIWLNVFLSLKKIHAIIVYVNPKDFSLVHEFEDYLDVLTLFGIHIAFWNSRTYMKDLSIETFFPYCCEKMRM